MLRRRQDIVIVPPQKTECRFLRCRHRVLVPSADEADLSYCQFVFRLVIEMQPHMTMSIHRAHCDTIGQPLNQKT
jgi:hypothetical protein